MKNIFYFKNINSIGGVEAFFYYLTKKYQKKDITIYFQVGNIEQIKRLSQYARVLRYNGEKIKCEKAFFNYNLDIIDNVEANEYVQIIHADYDALGVIPELHSKITKYIGVSEQACKSFKKVTGLDIELCYNPIILEKPKKVLNLISATRLTKEKGKDRLIRFAELLDSAGIKYIWTIFTNDVNVINNPNIIYMRPKLDIVDYIANADYLVQLSDNEAYCYSVVEALSVGTPVIVTDCPVFKEIGVTEDNGFILDFNLKNVPINEIYKGLPKFKYLPKKDRWSEILAEGKSSYQEEKTIQMLIKPIKSYTDMELAQEMTPESQPFIVDKVRAEYLEKVGVCKIIKQL